jgi:hypothetical protein
MEHLVKRMPRGYPGVGGGGVGIMTIMEELAVARRLAVILHRMWVDGTDFRWTRPEAAAAPN